MNERSISFTVFGVPQTQGNKSAYPYRKKNGKRGVSVVEARTPKSRIAFKQWRSLVAESARQWIIENTTGHHHEFDLFKGATELTVAFYVPVPKYAWKKALYPITRPDGLKYARAVEDSLTGIIYLDDSQNVDLHIKKRYAYTTEGPRVKVTVRELPNGDEL
jgi:Holliday junction resolvase RusA-like endonuclease